MSNTPSNPLLNILSNPGLVNFLQQKPLFSNILILASTIFTAITTLSTIILLFNKPSSLSNFLATASCEDYKEDVKNILQSNSASSEITSDKIPNPDISLNLEKYPELKHIHATCNYKVSQETHKFFIIDRLSEDVNYSKVQEIKVDKKDLDNYCQATEKENIDKKYPDKKVSSLPSIEAVLQTNQTNFYPVFRWKCQYKTDELSSSTDPKRPTYVLPPDNYGIDFDMVGKGDNGKSYCDTLKKSQSYVLRYHYYNDPNSLYCVNPNFH